MKEKVIKVDGKKICYWIKKKEVRKGKTLPPAIIFIHGAFSSLSALKWLIEPFKNRDFTLILVDLPGHGFSFRTSNYKDLLIEQQAKMIKRVLENEGSEKAILVGYSLGSMVAATFTALEKEKVLKLILISPGFGLPSWLCFLKKSNVFKKMIDFLIRVSSSSGIFTKRLNYEKFLNTGDFYWPRIFADLKHTSLKTAFSQLRAFLDWKGEKYFKMINTPTLIIAGKKDKIFPQREALKIKKLIKGAKIRMFAKADHMLVLNMPEKVAWKILNFI